MELKDEKIEILSAKIEDLRPYKLKKGEEEEVSRELNRLRNIQTLSEMLNTASFSLSGASEQPGAAELVNMCKVSLGQAAEFIPECKALKERLDELSIELDDIRHEITPFMTESSDAEKLPVYEERMSDFLRLRRKYGLSADELADETEKWQSELDALQGGDDFLQKLICDKKELGDRVKKLAAELTKKRKKAAGELSDAIRKELNYLDMPGIRLEFAVNQDKVTISGMDSAEMLIAVNRGEEPKPISKTASGGELSRIMLAVKIADRSRQSDDDATMIFDEIDSGISGRAAQKVGLKLTELSKNRQVLCVTHLAQIAAMADNHLLIEKFHQDGRTFTSVKRICGEERKRELARIISGDEDKLSLANAERLLNAAGSEPG
jgi:DNA repair protein RecN (Recombination protein N)